MTLRHLRELWRQPWFVAVTLVQPVIWLLLFGALFKKVVEIPGFHGGSYIAFLAPGVVVMTAMFNSAWSGMALIEDLNRGVTARFLVSPVRREALIAGRILKEAVVVVIQSVIIVLLALIVGADFPGGVGGVAALFAVSALLGATFGALSNGFGLIMRQEEALIGAVQFIVLPLTFLSATFLQPQPDAAVDRARGRLQPGQLGRGGRPERGVGAPRLGRGAGARWVCWRRCWRCAWPSRRGRSGPTSGRCDRGEAILMPAERASRWLQTGDQVVANCPASSARRWRGASMSSRRSSSSATLR